MKANKLKLETLTIKSFTTNLKTEEKQTVNGGYRLRNMTQAESVCWCIATQAAACTQYEGPSGGLGTVCG